LIGIDPNGELCEYLKGVAEAEDVQSFVKDNAFGLPALTSTHPHWNFYSRLRFHSNNADIRSFLL